MHVDSLISPSTKGDEGWGLAGEKTVKYVIPLFLWWQPSGDTMAELVPLTVR